MLLAVFNFTVFPLALAVAAGLQWWSVRRTARVQPARGELLRELVLPKLIAAVLVVGALPVALLSVAFLASVLLPDEAGGIVAALGATVGPSDDLRLGRIAVASMLAWSLLSAIVAAAIDQRRSSELTVRWRVSGLRRWTRGAIAASWLGSVLVWHELLLSP